tara:strand:- start:322 stop:936 length:615 start_codon:yes stop_codon:yes gene_type:complete
MLLDIVHKYNKLCNTRSDINEHLPTLLKYASECESILETGVRGCVSSWPLVLGLLSNNKPVKKILLNDRVECNIDELLHLTSDLDIDVKYTWIDNLDLNIEEDIDLTFIDTWHVYGQLKRELDIFSKVTKKYIIMHDTTVDAIYGSTLRMHQDSKQQSLSSGFPVEEITKGIWPAITEFLENNNDWIIKQRFNNNNGLTVLQKI